jgi:hypothetical protein
LRRHSLLKNAAVHKLLLYHSLLKEEASGKNLQEVNSEKPKSIAGRRILSSCRFSIVAAQVWA